LVRTQVSRLRSYTLHVASGTLVLAVATWMTLDSPAAYALGALAVGMPGAFAVARMRTRPQRWELRVTYRGTRVLLYTSTDVRGLEPGGRRAAPGRRGRRPPVDNRDLAAA
jgi:hypothetical protein